MAAIVAVSSAIGTVCLPFTVESRTSHDLEISDANFSGSKSSVKLNATAAAPHLEACCGILLSVGLEPSVKVTLAVVLALPNRNSNCFTLAVRALDRAN